MLLEALVLTTAVSGITPEAPSSTFVVVEAPLRIRLPFQALLVLESVHTPPTVCALPAQTDGLPPTVTSPPEEPEMGPLTVTRTPALDVLRNAPLGPTVIPRVAPRSIPVVV